ncbi:MAG: FecR family protein [Terriglobales bacterium]
MRMFRSLMVNVLSAGLVCLPLMAGDGALLTPNGTVTLNGQRAAAGALVSSGDAIATGADGTARLIFNRAAIEAASRTQFTLASVGSQRQVRLQNGMLRVTGVPVVAAGRTIRPATAASRFEIAAVNGPVYIHAVKGDLTISGAAAPLTVHAGETVTVQDTTGASTAASAGSSGFAFTPLITIAVVAAAAGITFGVSRINSNNAPAPGAVVSPSH